MRDRACSTTSFLRGLSYTAQELGEGGEAGAETAPGCAVEAQTQGRKQDGGRGLWERKRGFPGGGGAEAGERGTGGVEGTGLTAPSPAPSEAARVGRLGVEAGAQLASSGNQRAREGHRRRQWDCVSVGEYVCTLKGGGRRVGEREEGAGSTEALAGAYVRAGAGPGWGEPKTKGLLRFPPAGGCGGPREGAESTEGWSPRNAPCLRP